MRKQERKIYEMKQMEQEQLMNNVGIPLDNYTTSQNINAYDTVNRWGMDLPVITCNTRVGHNIQRLPCHNFGSIGEYNVNTLPNSYLSRNGIEKFELNQDDDKIYNNREVISKRYLCNILNEWCKVIRVTYLNGINLWAKKKEYTLPQEHYIVVNRLYKEDGIIKSVKEYQPHHYNKPVTKIYKMLSGEEGVLMIKDLLYLIRNKDIKQLKDRARQPIISQQLNGILQGYIDSNQEHIIMEMKDRLYLNYNARDKSWAYPKYSVEYLVEQIKQIQSGEYYNEMYIPVIYQLTKYPFKCTDMHIRPISIKEHNQAKDDYDGSQYLTEY